jgi:hypothetical protein
MDQTATVFGSALNASRSKPDVNQRHRARAPLAASNTTRFLPVSIDHPEGTVKVAPLGVARGVLAATRSGADRASCVCGNACRGDADVDACANALSPRSVTKAVRHVNM